MIAAAAPPQTQFDLWGANAPPGAALSPSQVGTYLDCSASWHYRHRLKLPDVVTAALALGRAVHEAILGYVSLSARGPGLADANTIAAAARLATAEELKGAELREDEDAGEIIDKAEDMARAFATQAPRLDPVMIEQPSQDPRPAR